MYFVMLKTNEWNETIVSTKKAKKSRVLYIDIDIVLKYSLNISIYLIVSNMLMALLFVRIIGVFADYNYYSRTQVRTYNCTGIFFTTNVSNGHNFLGLGYRVDRTIVFSFTTIVLNTA